MTKKEQTEILKKAEAFYKNDFVANHITNLCPKASKLKNYNINPFLLKYLSNFLTGNEKPRSIAQALIYPRILGTSITTSFGTKMQTGFINSVLNKYGSVTSGIDIEFKYRKDKRKKYCQLKAGPNCINKDDIATIKGHFNQLRGRARTNRLDVRQEDMIIGVLYGDQTELNSHYRKLGDQYDIWIGKEFWQRLTGSSNIYYKLIEAFSKAAIEVDGRKVLNKTIRQLTKEIEETKLF